MITKNTKPLLVGLTGGIASGKSTVIKNLIEEGYAVIDADKLGHRVLDPGTPGFKKILETFGKKILDPNGTVDRHALGKIVFDAETRKTIFSKGLGLKTGNCFR